MNNPYSTEKESYLIHYSSFAERPKHLDPVSSYSENEARFISQIYEPLVQYHYLDRPYRLEALTATKLFEPMLVHDESINYSIYKVRIKPVSCISHTLVFAKDPQGNFVYLI